MEIKTGKLYKYVGIGGKAIWLHMHLGYIYPNEIAMILEANWASSNVKTKSAKIISQNGIVGYVFFSEEEWENFDY
jgi:hypothetical protein